MLQMQREHDDRTTVRVVEHKNRYGQKDLKGGLSRVYLWERQRFAFADGASQHAQELHQTDPDAEGVGTNASSQADHQLDAISRMLYDPS